MTADKARDRAGVVRGRLREAVRALSVPDTDWERACVSLMWAATLAMELARDCMREDEMASDRRTCRWCRYKDFLWWADLHVCTKEAEGPVVVWPELTACEHFEEAE